MGRVTARTKIVHLTVGGAADAAMVRRMDTLAAEEPLEIRVGSRPLAVTMRTPGDDVELAAGFLVSEGVITRAEQFASAIHCAGADSRGPDGANTYNVLDVALAAGTAPPDPARARHSYTTSACGVCGAASIDQVRTSSVFDVSADDVRVDIAVLARLPEALRARQAVFDRTGGLHAAALCDARTGDVLAVREDVGRHNAVDKVIGWAVLHDRLPLRGTVLQVSGRASFELVQKAVMAGIPILSAVSAPSSLAVALAETSGLTLVGFARGTSMNVYAAAERIAVDEPVPV
ncbi:formate dehydrogenase accessory sulfurtransferase FdhD [Microbacterium luticocti]|uniref:formate dehydrogenase accessory sulfurtransferase FdhD n=1 Tax=Microbacterium luticocti TaxID=451764 RepID=UPI000414101C|nr:formate dehydrogenase accessory sulfurtransferase FdhD [Microbacterium luticocti]